MRRILLSIFLILNTFTYSKSYDAKEIYKSFSSRILHVVSDDDKDDDKAWFGTAFILNSKYIVTNKHVLYGLDGSYEVKSIKDQDKKEFKFENIICSKRVDICVVEYKNPYKRNFSSLKFSEKIERGDMVFSIGHPKGVMWNLSEGIISSTTRNLGNMQLHVISVPTSSGNSGSPLLNERGELVGIVLAGFIDAENLNLAITTNEFKHFLNAVENELEGSYNLFEKGKMKKDVDDIKEVKLKKTKNKVFLNTENRFSFYVGGAWKFDNRQNYLEKAILKTDDGTLDGNNYLDFNVGISYRKHPWLSRIATEWALDIQASSIKTDSDEVKANSFDFGYFVLYEYTGWRKHYIKAGIGYSHLKISSDSEIKLSADTLMASFGLISNFEVGKMKLFSGVEYRIRNYDELAESGVLLKFGGTF